MEEVEVELWEAPTWTLAADPGGHFRRGRDAVLFVLDCADVGSVEDILSHWLQVSRYHRVPGSLCFFVGTKADLASTEDLAAVRERLDDQGLPHLVGSCLEPSYGREVLSELLRRRSQSRPEPPLLAALPAFRLPWKGESTSPQAPICERPPERQLPSPPLSSAGPLRSAPDARPGEKDSEPPLEGSEPRGGRSGETWEIPRSELDVQQGDGGALDGAGSGAWRGRAGRSRTRRATWSGRQVAVKEISMELLLQRAGSHEDLRKRLGVLCGLRCDCLARLHGACLQERSGLLVSEFMPGGDLEQYIRGRRHAPHEPWRPPGPDILRWALAVAEALDYLHERCSRPLVHGNLRPGCLLLAADRSLKLSLCGMASPLEHGVKQGDTSLANCLYSAPEVLLGRPYDAEADIFSFALILWFMCTGVRPLAHLDNDGGHMPSDDVLQAFTEGRPPRPSLRNLARGPLLPTIMREAWDASPEQRPKASDLVRRLREVAPRGPGAIKGGSTFCCAQ